MKSVFVFSLACLALIFAGFALQPHLHKHDKYTLRIVLDQEPSTLNPNHSPAYAVSQIVFYNLYEPLIKADFDGSLSPYLLEKWVYSDEGLTYIFTLKKNLTFHNKEPLDAAQLKICLEHLISSTKHPHPQYYAAIDQMTVLDELNLKIQLSEPDANFLYNLSRPVSSIAYPGSDFIGTGPYEFKSWHKHHAVTLKRYKKYRDFDKTSFKKVLYSFVPEPFAQYHMLTQKDADIVLNFRQYAATDMLKNQSKINYQQAKSHGKVILAMNHQTSAFQEKSSRESFAALIDKDTYITASFFENTAPLASHFSPFHKDAILPKAMSEGEQFEAPIKPLRIVVPPFDYAQYSAELLMATLRNHHIPFTIKSVEWGEWLQTVYKDRNYDLTFISHIEPLDIHIYAKENYYFNYQNVFFNQALQSLKASTGAQEYSYMFQKMQEILREDHANIFLMSMPTLILYQKNISHIARDNSNYIFPIQAIRRGKK